MKNNIFFDLDDTILDFHAAEKIAVAKTLTSLGIEPTDEVIDRYHLLNIEQWKKLELGLITRDEVKVKRYEALFSELQVDTSATLAAATYESNLAHGHFFMPGAPKLLETLYGKKKLYLVSNGTAPVQESRIKSAGIKKYFEKIFISEIMGKNKPSPEFFDICFNETGISRDDTIIIGDSLTSDIKGGINAGITTVWYNQLNAKNTQLIRPDYEIHDLSEVLTLPCLFD